jgi:predicted ATP-grasp superfamily ATP-dependent carboligase
VRKLKVLITDAENKHSLGAIRSLGKKGIEVVAASNFDKSVSFYSKYCKKHYLYSNQKNEIEFISDIIRIIKKENCDVLLPIGYNSCKVVSKYKQMLTQYVKVPISDYESMQIASDKNETVKFAINCGVSTPKTVFPKSLSESEIDEISKSLKYPVVLKAPEETGSVKYANNEQELQVMYREVCTRFQDQIKAGKTLQIQEYVPGEIYGFFALFNNGKIRAIFAHKRLHQYPSTGGPSTMAQSFYDPELNAIGLKLLTPLNWHGVAMVEFKKDTRDNKYKLIEINPKFWGSLDLAIASGVNFPYLACKMCIDGDIEPEFEYNKNLIFRWVAPDLLYSISKNCLREYLMNFFRKDITDDLDYSDIRPTKLQFQGVILSAVKEPFKRILNKLNMQKTNKNYKLYLEKDTHVFKIK